MNLASTVFCISLSIVVRNNHQIGPNNQNALSVIVRNQVSKMGQAFINGDYKTVAYYTYPEIVKMMGGESKMKQTLAKLVSDMNVKGMMFNSITFGDVSKIVKSGNELQCTIPQHTEIKLLSGRAISTSILIGISTDGGSNWTFIDTSDKDITTIKRLLPNLSSAIVITPQEPPVRYAN